MTPTRGLRVCEGVEVVEFDYVGSKMDFDTLRFCQVRVIDLDPARFHLGVENRSSTHFTFDLGRIQFCAILWDIRHRTPNFSVHAFGA